MATASLTIRFLRRELRNRFAGSFSGALWALLQPLVQLAVYSVVFVYVFKARVPGGGDIDYVAFLAVAIWPWTAFSEAILRSATSVHDNAALIGKVALPREVLVLASVGSSFAVHLAGFLAILAVLALTGHAIAPAGVVLAVLLYALLLALATGFALVAAAVQVFVRDLVQALGQILTLLMYAAPIFYDRNLLPEQWRGWLDLNPFTFYAEAFRAVLLGHGHVEPQRLAIAFALAALVAWAGHRIFRRLDPHFEDFL